MSSPLPPSTALLLVDPYNDFLHPDGKLYPRVAESLVATDTVAHLKDVVKAARNAHLPIFYALHQTWKEENYRGWLHMNSSTTAIKQMKAFEEGSWGAKVHEGLEPDGRRVEGEGDVVDVVSGFANTDLDFQLRQREITHLIIAGMVANTCIESTARYARELGYHTTLLTDATAGFSTAAKDAATNLIWPLIADEVKTVNEWTAALQEAHGPGKM
ncbi:hypothetical protein SLS58_008584 [Diplodia intermedia]|uniref:Isochorismatase-like domain-containing protein n=1 Tax=Diplodia intermedia TaxID=856260 RepID=A0ABR3TGX4_9PEZI